MNFNPAAHVGPDAEHIEYSQTPCFDNQATQATQRYTNPALAAVLVDIAFIVRASQAHRQASQAASEPNEKSKPNEKSWLFSLCYTRAPAHVQYLAGLFPDVQFHIYDGDHQAGPNIHIYTRLFDAQDMQEWRDVPCAFNFYHGGGMPYDGPNMALYKYGPHAMVATGDLLYVPYGEQLDGLAVVYRPNAARIKYKPYRAIAALGMIDGVDIYASSHAARVKMDNCYDCYAARDIIGQYLELRGIPNTAANRYKMFDDAGGTPATPRAS